MSPSLLGCQLRIHRWKCLYLSALSPSLLRQAMASYHLCIQRSVHTGLVTWSVIRVFMQPCYATPAAVGICSHNHSAIGLPSGLELGADIG